MLFRLLIGLVLGMLAFAVAGLASTAALAGADDLGAFLGLFALVIAVLKAARAADLGQAAGRVLLWVGELALASAIPFSIGMWREMLAKGDFDGLLEMIATGLFVTVIAALVAVPFLYAGRALVGDRGLIPHWLRPLLGR